MVGRRRAEADRLLLARHPEVDIVVCDDGMQHWALARDLTVVVFDERGSGNGWLLPAGLLREPWPARAWGEGELLLLRTARPDAELAPLQPARPGSAIHMARRELASHAVAADGRQQPLSQLAQQAAWRRWPASRMQRFSRCCARAAWSCGRRSPADHADGAALLAALQAAQRQGLVWLCTEKDAVKLFPLLAGQPGIALWTVPLEQTPEPAFWDELDGALKGCGSDYHPGMDAKLLELLVCPVTKGS